MKFQILYSEVAKEDIRDLTNYIVTTCKAPLTSTVYMKGLFKTINGLQKSADAHPISTGKFSKRYGWNARRINHKKMAIIYTIHDHSVLINRIISGALVFE
jgi:hypothetical protein